MAGLLEGARELPYPRCGCVVVLFAVWRYSPCDANASRPLGGPPIDDVEVDGCRFLEEQGEFLPCFGALVVRQDSGEIDRGEPGDPWCGQVLMKEVYSEPLVELFEVIRACVDGP